LNARVVEVWNVNEGLSLVRIPAGPTPCLGFSPDGRWLLTGSAEEYVFWDRRSWTQRKTVPRGLTGGTHGRCAFTKDGGTVALSMGAGVIGLYDTTSFECLATLEPPEVKAVADLDFNPDGSQLAVASGDQSIHLWDLRLLHRELAELNLDFRGLPLPDVPKGDRPIEITFSDMAIRSHREFLRSRLAARDIRCGTNQIDLTPFYNAALNESWMNPAWTGNNLAALPQGLQTLDGMLFDIRGVIQLSCAHPDLAIEYPKEVEGIPVHQRSRALHFLHSAGWEAATGAEIGNYIIRYEDGFERSAPIVYAENTWRWWGFPGQTAPCKAGTALAWSGRNSMSDQAGQDLLLFHFRWENPRPEAPIASISFRSSMSKCAPFLIAITAE
jgi:hypothetical protein